MSTKKETERSSTLYDDKREARAGLLELNHALDRALDETRDNIAKTINEVKREIPRNTQAINDYQEHTLQVLSDFDLLFTSITCDNSLFNLNYTRK